MLDNLEDALADLKAKALKATPGPWELCGEDNGANAVVTSRSNNPVKIVATLINKKEDQNFIVAANPQAILELIEAYERLEKEADWLASRCEEFCLNYCYCADCIMLMGPIKKGKNKCALEIKDRFHKPDALPNWRKAAQQAISKKGREENHADR